MDRIDTTTLLSLHARAYELLMYIDEQARTDPRWLSVESIDRLTTSGTAAAWLEEHRDQLPPELMPDAGQEAPFAHLLGSFFEVSFRVERCDLDGRLLDARLRRRYRNLGGSRGVAPVVAMAVRHLLSGEGIDLLVEEARMLIDRQDVRTEARILAYLWELDRRARNRSKGPVVHALWNAIPPTVRRELDENVVWLAETRVLEAAAEIIAARDSLR